MALSLAERVLSGALAVLALGVLVLASTLSPSERGHGTHESMGLPPCGFAVATGRPCPTCGMTTAFAHAAGAEPVEAFVTQPFGAGLAVLAAMLVWMLGHSALTGSVLARELSRLLVGRTIWVGVGLLLAAWAYKAAIWEG